MKIVKLVALIGTIFMSIALINGFINGDFFEDGSNLLENPWGIVSLVDLYVGFGLFSMWIIYRENALLPKILWIILLMIFGFLTASIYVFYVFHKSDNNLLKAIHGHHAKQYTEMVE